MLSTLRKKLFISVCIAGIYACSSPPGEVRVAQVFANANCQQPQGLSELPSPESLQQALAPHSTLSPTAVGAPITADFDPSARYFLLSLGTKTSGGYGLDLKQSIAAVRDQTAWVDIKIREPEPGMMTTQALTSPCLIFRIDRAEYNRVAITDQDQWVQILEP